MSLLEELLKIVKKHACIKDFLDWSWRRVLTFCRESMELCGKLLVRVLYLKYCMSDDNW